MQSSDRPTRHPVQGLRARLLLPASAVLAALAVSSAWPGCSLVIDGNSESCTEDADCVNHPGKSLCDTEQGVCISPDQCTVNADCGSEEICTFASPRNCQPIRQGNCQTLFPDDAAVYLDDNALLIGVTAPLTEGGNPSSTGISIFNGAKLAVTEINGASGANGNRPMVLIGCDDNGEVGPAEDNGQTLATLGVQAIIGPAFSGQTLDMTRGPNYEDIGTVERGVLNISSSATSTEITGIADKAPSCRDTTPDDCPGLVWRTSPSDETQGKGMIAYFPQLQDIALARVEPDRTNVKVVILHKGDSYGTRLADFVFERLDVNGELAINSLDALKLNYGDTSLSGVTPDTDIIQQAIDFQADVYFLIGTNELGVIDDGPGVMELIETGWSDPEPTSEPYYMFADGGLTSEVVNAANMIGAATRVRGTIPGTIAVATDDPIALFTGRYNAAGFTDDVGGPEVFGAAGAYDATYLLAYSVAFANGAPMTGEQFARGLLRVSEGSEVIVGQGDFGTANNTLQNGGTIDFRGASGPLDFDPTKGEADSDIQIWCIDGTTGVFSNLYYSALDETMVGDTDPGGATCPF